MLSYDYLSGTVIVLGKCRIKIKAAIEDVRMALSENFLASSILEGIYFTNSSSEDCIDELCLEFTSSNGGLADGHSILQTVDDSGLENKDEEDRFVSIPFVGDEIEVYWPDDSA